MNKEIILYGALFLFLLFAYLGNYSIQKMHSGGFYRTEEIYENLGPVIYYEEGLYATVTVRELFGEGKALFLNGKGQGGSSITDLRVNFLLAYLPILIKPETEEALVIGLGTGTTSGQLSQVSKTKTVEIEPKVAGAVSYFATFNLNVLENPNHTLVIDDARNYLLKNNEEYDIISQEPSDPWQSFSGALYSKEFLELVKEDLKGDGLYVHWVPIYTMSVEDFRSLYKTFDSVFPNIVAFANIKSTENTPIKFETTELILVGSKEKIIVSNQKFVEVYNTFPEISKQKLSSIKLSSGADIYNLLLFTDKDLEGYANGYDLVTDDNLLLEFSTAKNVYDQKPEVVINDIKKFIGGQNE